MANTSASMQSSGMFRTSKIALCIVGDIQSSPVSSVVKAKCPLYLPCNPSYNRGSLAMKVLLLYPEFPDTFWSFKYALKFIRKKACFPPLGLLTVAAMLPRSWEKRLVDLNVRRLAENDLLWADLVFISSMIVQRESVKPLVERCRSAGKTIVAGGPLFTSEHEQFPGVDHFVLNEAELTLPGFLHDLATGCASPVHASTEFPDIRRTPTPLWELADLRRYASMSIQYSRGCPFDCEFCDVTAKLGHRPRTKTAAQIIDELNGLRRLGWRGPVFFVDDNLIGNKSMLKTELLPALIEWRRSQLGIPFFTEASINLADDKELMHLMAQAGFVQVFIGVETPDERSLAECNKRQNQGRDLIADVKRIQRAGLQVQGGFIVGFDSDTPTIFRRQVEVIQKSGIVTAMVGLLQAPPGTRLYERLDRVRRVIGRPTGDNVDGTTNIIPAMGLDALRDGYKGILEYIYAPRHYYARVRTMLREFKTPRIRDTLDWQRVKAFLRASLRLGILGKERFQYWRLLAWTCFRRPELLPEAVKFTIFGYHFRKICELHVL